ncbi:tyrosine-type recombinase/integrase [Roseibium album]|uniref:tyrosine-type recombinase/integrase n=1 Tax=Roseibium album TaxID=311410 RepID=UPI0024908855|nr:tyrosine-type recombinase/integrase [Roseibium album]
MRLYPLLALPNRRLFSKESRHAYGIHAIASSVPLHMLQRWLGHADMKTTAIYVQAVGPEERQIAARMW